MSHLGHQPRSEVRAMTLEQLFVEATEVMAFACEFRGVEVPWN